jgi:hypothetical protein
MSKSPTPQDTAVANWKLLEFESDGIAAAPVTGSFDK